MLQLLNLQKKVRFEVSAERRLQQLCENPRQLFDWSLMRPQRNDVANSLARWDLRGSTTNHFAIEIDMKQRRRRDVEVWKYHSASNCYGVLALRLLAIHLPLCFLHCLPFLRRGELWKSGLKNKK